MDRASDNAQRLNRFLMLRELVDEVEGGCRRNECCGPRDGGFEQKDRPARRFRGTTCSERLGMADRPGCAILCGVSARRSVGQRSSSGGAASTGTDDCACRSDDCAVAIELYKQRLTVPLSVGKRAGPPEKRRRTRRTGARPVLATKCQAELTGRARRTIIGCRVRLDDVRRLTS